MRLVLVCRPLDKRIVPSFPICFSDSTQKARDCNQTRVRRYKNRTTQSHARTHARTKARTHARTREGARTHHHSTAHLQHLRRSSCSAQPRATTAPTVEWRELTPHGPLNTPGRDRHSESGKSPGASHPHDPRHRTRDNHRRRDAVQRTHSAATRRHGLRPSLSGLIEK
jgi:hypothetical protein